MKLKQAFSLIKFLLIFSFSVAFVLIIAKTSVNKFSDREYISIVYNYPRVDCTKENNQNQYIKDVIVSIDRNDIKCEDFGRKDNNTTCATLTLDYENEKQSCIVGFNKVK